MKLLSILLLLALSSYVKNEDHIYDSFIETKNTNMLRATNSHKIKSENGLEEKETAMLTLKDLLVASMGSQRKTRVSQENLKCAHAFVANGKTYFDCTLDRAPDGQIPTKEWCFLEKNPKSDKIWDYCKPDMNYDKIRSKVQTIIKSLTDKSREMQAKCEKVSPQQSDLIGDFKSLIQVQSDLTSKVATLYNESLAAKNSLDYLRSASDEWESMEGKAVEIAQLIDRELEKIKILKEEADEKKRKEESAEIKPKKYSPEQIKKESEATKLLIADWIQEKEPIYQKDCNGMLNYEEEPQGTGLIGKYFNNPTFSGSYKKRLDQVINFELTGTQPMDGINMQNYSIQWDGYVQAPYRGKFFFSIETEGGAEVFLSGKKIISHRMYSSDSESGDRSQKLLGDTFKSRKDPSNNNINKKISKGINLSGGDKYIIRIKYYICILKQ